MASYATQSDAQTRRPDGLSELDWRLKPQRDLEHVIIQFKASLPGWWYSVCECQVSCDASCAPTIQSPHIDLIAKNSAFDSGFHADLRQPSTLADALRDVMRQAITAIEAAE